MAKQSKKQIIQNALQIPGLMLEEELSFIYDHPFIKGRGLETGTYFGRTSYVLVAKCDHLTSVDLFSNMHLGERREEYEQHTIEQATLYLADYMDKIDLIPGISYEFSSNDKYDFAFIDGDHRPDEVYADLIMASKHTKHILGHDGNNGHVQTALTRFCKEKNVMYKSHNIGYVIWEITL